jgi:hypothetical protein
MTRRRVTLEARITQIKAAIAAVGDLRPGTLSQQYNVCGKPDCRCKATPPKKHGPYYQLSFTWQGKSQSQFVRRAEVPTVRQQVGNYQRLRTLVDTWVGVAMELSRLRLQEARASRAKLRPTPRVSGQTRDGRASSVSP